MINQKILVIEFVCDCCGKKTCENYDLSDGNSENSRRYPEKWTYIANKSYADFIVCDECWNIYKEVKILIE
jgi:hypothetical protein